jgi:hypothetical protein
MADEFNSHLHQIMHNKPPFCGHQSLDKEEYWNLFDEGNSIAKNAKINYI